MHVGVAAAPRPPVRPPGTAILTFDASRLILLNCSWSSQLQTLEFQELIMFLQRPPTSGWGEKDIELVLSRAYM